LTDNIKNFALVKGKRAGFLRLVNMKKMEKEHFHHIYPKCVLRLNRKSDFFGY